MITQLFFYTLEVFCVILEEVILIILDGVNSKANLSSITQKREQEVRKEEIITNGHRKVGVSRTRENKANMFQGK